jgi:hypothetical protein
MTRQNINIGSSANDGTGDTLRSAGTKINANFQEIYTQLGGNSSTLSELVKLKDSGTIGTIQFEGTSTDSHETKLIAINPTADRTISLPNATGTIILQDTTDTLTNKTLTTPTIASIINGGTVTIPSGADTLVARTSADTLTNKTLTTPTINSPIIGTAINDANGNEIIITIANGASITGPTISATGSGTNLNLRLASKGTGSVSLSKASFTSATITANGAANSAVTYIIGNKASPLAVSLADGTTVGEYKIFTNKGAGVMTVTPSNFSQGTTFALAQNDGCTCIWDGSNWSLIGNQGEVTVA